jgi:hypothetical protein
LQCTIAEGVLVDSLKLTVMKPLLKKGQKDSVTNYRPISLTSTFRKVVETFLIKYLKKETTADNDIIPADIDIMVSEIKRSATTAASEFVQTAL